MKNLLYLAVAVVAVLVFLPAIKARLMPEPAPEPAQAAPTATPTGTATATPTATSRPTPSPTATSTMTPTQTPVPVRRVPSGPEARSFNDYMTVYVRDGVVHLQHCPLDDDEDNDHAGFDHHRQGRKERARASASKPSKAMPLYEAKQLYRPCPACFPETAR